MPGRFLRSPSSPPCSAHVAVSNILKFLQHSQFNCMQHTPLPRSACLARTPSQILTDSMPTVSQSGILPSDPAAPSPLTQPLASHAHTVRVDGRHRLCLTTATSAGYVRVAVQVSCVVSSPAPSPAGSVTVMAARRLPVSEAEGSGPQPPAPAASAGPTAHQLPPPPPPVQLWPHGEEDGITPLANIVVVTTVDELVLATQERAQDIEIRAHLDLRMLDGRTSGNLGQRDSDGPLESSRLSQAGSLLVSEPPTRSIRACSPFL